jgi:predicted enzyme related to lactoylglutathione lyase
MLEIHFAKRCTSGLLFSYYPSSVIYFNVSNIEEGYRALTASGVKFEAPPHLIARMGSYDLWMAFFRDSENNLLGLMSKISPRE